MATAFLGGGWMPNSRLFVGNVPYVATEADIRDVFAQLGSVKSVRIITDYDTGRSKGYAFVEMSTPEEAQRAIKELNNYSLSGRAIVVNEARPRLPGGGSGGPRMHRT
jgi:cold-inducible RNA-binding protein